MRLSIREDDPGYDKRAMGCSVFVDGVEVTNRCFTADEEQGMAWCFKHNEFGNSFPDPDNSNNPAEEVLTGKVIIVLPRNRVNGYDAHPCD